MHFQSVISVILFSTMLKGFVAEHDTEFGNPGALCNVDGIQSEIKKVSATTNGADAITLLKEKELSSNPSQPLIIPDTTKINTLRQDDDDDIPYYVPAIAKVVGSVLAQNATNIIEESFGFIPPEVNKNIRYVLGLVSETIEKLRPSMKPKPAAVVEKPTADSANAVPNPNGQATDIESLLAFALAMELGNQLGVEILNMTEAPSPTESTSLPPSTDDKLPMQETEDQKNHVVNIADVLTPAEIPASDKIDSKISPTSAPEFLIPKTTLKSIGLHPETNSNDVFVYAPAYAPNYGVTTTKIPIFVYAEAFGHNEHKYEPTTNKVEVTAEIDVKNPVFPPKSETTTEEAVSTTTGEDDDDEALVEENTTASGISAASGGTTNAPDNSVTTTDEDYEEQDNEDEDAKRRSL